MPYCWAHWVEFFPQLQRLEEPYADRAQGLAMRYGRRIYDMDAQLERVKSWERVAARGRPRAARTSSATCRAARRTRGSSSPRSWQSVIEDRGTAFMVNTINGGLIATCPPRRGGGARHRRRRGGTPAGHPGPAARTGGGLCLHAQVQAMTMQSALTGDRGLLRQAMLADPLVAATLEPHQIEALTRRAARGQRPLPPAVRDRRPPAKEIRTMALVTERPPAPTAATTERHRLRPTTLAWLLPAAALLIGLFLVPVGYAIYLGFTNLELLGQYAQTLQLHRAGQPPADGPRSDVLVQRQADPHLRDRLGHRRPDRARPGAGAARASAPTSSSGPASERSSSWPGSCRRSRSPSSGTRSARPAARSAISDRPPQERPAVHRAAADRLRGQRLARHRLLDAGPAQRGPAQRSGRGRRGGAARGGLATGGGWSR